MPAEQINFLFTNSQQVHIDQGSVETPSILPIQKVGNLRSQINTEVIPIEQKSLKTPDLVNLKVVNIKSDLSDQNLDVSTQVNPVKNTSIQHCMNTPNQLYNDLSVVIPIVGLTLVIIGWRVIYKNAKKIATRAETKSLVDDIVKIFNELESLTVHFWLSGRQNRRDADEFILLISAKIQTLTSRIKFLKKRNIDTSCINLAALHEYMTLNCEDVDRRTNEQNREQLQLFLEESNRNVNDLYSEYQKRYSPSFTRFKFNKKYKE